MDTKCMEMKSKYNNAKEYQKYYYMRKFLIICTVIIGFGFNANAQWIDGSTYDRVNAQLSSIRTGSGSNSNRNNSQVSDIATQTIYKATDAFVTGFINWLFDGEARRARQMEVQQILYQLELQRQEKERFEKEQERIKQELFLADVAKTFDSFVGYDDFTTFEGSDDFTSFIGYDKVRNNDLNFIIDAELLDDTEGVYSRNLFGIKADAVLLDDDENLFIEENDNVVAFIGKSGTPIYKNTSDLNLNMDIQQPTHVPEMINTIDTYKAERERIAAATESFRLQKEELERKWEEIAKECSRSKNEFLCVNQLKSISEKIEALTIQIAKTEWLQSLVNLSPAELQQQKEYYQNLYNMALFANHSYGNDTPLPKGFKKPNNDNLNNLVEDYNKSTSLTGLVGFSCEVFQNKEGKYIVAFRGTDPPDLSIKQLKETTTDFAANLLEALVPIAQTKAAQNLIKDLMYKYEISADNITVTGHSLGGRLAAETAIKHGLTAYTFNAADISVSTKAAIKGSNYKNQKTNIINTVSSNDWLTGTVGLGSYFGGNVSNNIILKEANGGHSMTDLSNNILERLTDIYHFLYQNK